MSGRKSKPKEEMTFSVGLAENVKAVITKVDKLELKPKDILILKSPRDQMDDANSLAGEIVSVLRTTHPEWNGSVVVLSDTIDLQALGWLAEFSDDAMRAALEVLGAKLRQLEQTVRMRHADPAADFSSLLT